MSHGPKGSNGPSNLSSSDQDHLNGWKEIGAFLGKGVRTVQRWEKDYGLPIHRIGRQGGEIVWASRDELDEWLRTHGPRVPADDAEHDAAPTAEAHAESHVKSAGDSLAVPPSTSRPAIPSRVPRQGPWLPSALAYGIVAVAVLWVSASLFRPAVSEPASWEMKGQRFTVVDRDGRVVFFKDFPFIQAGEYPAEKEGRLGGRVVFADLDGDGAKEVLVAAATAHFPPEMGVFAYGADGAERFVVRPQQQVTFGSKTYVGPWMPYRLFVIGEGADLSIFAVFIGADEFPSLLLELDDRGKVRSEYWSNGYIEWVTRATWRGRDALFVGATHNDTYGGSVAVFPDGRASGSAPAVREAYRCVSCAPGDPAEFLVFPRRALSEAYPGGTAGATVTDIRVLQDGKIRVSVGEGNYRPADGLFDSVVWYTLGSSLTGADAELTPGLFAEHGRQFSAGLVKHPFGKADEDALFPVKKWDGRGFVDLSRGGIVR